MAAEPEGLTEEELERIADNSRLLSEFKQKQLEAQAARNWDIFYKRNTDKFFKDRHWTTREYEELLGKSFTQEEKLIVLEVGCGVGNFLFPLLQENPNIFFYACDFSKRAIDIVKSRAEYSEQRCSAFVCDITTDGLMTSLPDSGVDLVSMVFVLSAIHPDKMKQAIDNIYKVLRPGGMLLFRDYALYDHAQVRFNPRQKLSENLYVRQDGTRSYFFSNDHLRGLCQSSGFEVAQCEVVHRETINHKEELRVARRFLQGKFRKPESSPDALCSSTGQPNEEHLQTHTALNTARHRQSDVQTLAVQADTQTLADTQTPVVLQADTQTSTTKLDSQTCSSDTQENQTVTHQPRHTDTSGTSRHTDS